MNALGKLENIHTQKGKREKHINIFPKYHPQWVTRSNCEYAPYATPCSSPITPKRPGKLHHTEPSAPQIHQLRSLWLVEWAKLRPAAKCSEQELTASLEGRKEAQGADGPPCSEWALLAWLQAVGGGRWVSAPSQPARGQLSCWGTPHAWQPVLMPSCLAQTSPQQLPQI